MKVYLLIYKDCVMFGNFDENGEFYYYELIRYYKDAHGNNSTNNCFYDLLLKYSNDYTLEKIIDRRFMNYLKEN